MGNFIVVGQLRSSCPGGPVLFPIFPPIIAIRAIFHNFVRFLRKIYRVGCALCAHPWGPGGVPIYAPRPPIYAKSVRILLILGPRAPPIYAIFAFYLEGKREALARVCAPGAPPYICEFACKSSYIRARVRAREANIFAPPPIYANSNTLRARSALRSRELSPYICKCEFASRALRASLRGEVGLRFAQPGGPHRIPLYMQIVMVAHAARASRAALSPPGDLPYKCKS